MAPLTPAMERFVLHWGEMGSKWGINRTVAQIHALLFISPEPLNAETIVETLKVARSNVSTSLRELLGWGIVRVVHVMGDRRDHYTSMKDVWEMFQIILDERKRREIDPTLAVIRECVAQAGKSPKAEVYFRERLTDMLGFFETMSGWYEDIRKLPTGAVIKFMNMGGKVRRMFGIGA